MFIVFIRIGAGSRRAIGIPHTKSGGGGILRLDAVRHGPGLTRSMFLNRISGISSKTAICKLQVASNFWPTQHATTLVVPGHVCQNVGAHPSLQQPPLAKTLEILLRNMCVASPGPCRMTPRHKNPPPPLFVRGIPIALRDPARNLRNTAEFTNLRMLRSPCLF